MAAATGGACRFLDAAKVLALVPWGGEVAPGSSLSGDAGHRAWKGRIVMKFWGKIETSRRLLRLRLARSIGI